MPLARSNSAAVPRRIWTRRRVAIVLLLAAPLLLWQPALTGVAKFMNVADPLETADYILPLYRDGVTIPPAAADLYKRQYAPKILLYRTPPSRLESVGLSAPAHIGWKELLEHHGIPASAIITMEETVRSDADLGRALARVTAPSRPARVLVLTFGPMSRLSRNDLRKGAGGAVDVRVYPVTPRNIDPKAWWRTRSAWIVYFDSYMLWLLRYIR